ncbi:hypothetical protein BSZ32_06325 [Rubritalea profundi]|uniref:Leucine-rich repeat domain-containing protein n=2 Tax=Rubritalea profundi TaxID=1658618 RepID=A0A2S7U1V2_9BACT|nr:hypothetical protein BSZ32_06325 [Rubritalea profundi]
MKTHTLRIFLLLVALLPSVVHAEKPSEQPKTKEAPLKKAAPSLTELSANSGQLVCLIVMNLKKVTIPEGVTKIGAMTFNGCKNLTSITIPDSVKSFGFGAFQHSGLTSLILPSGIKSLPTATFAFCKNLTSLTVPKGVTRIGQYTFGMCPKLKEIIFLGNAPTFHADALKNSTPTIYRKSGAKGWGKTWAGRPVKLIGATK